MKGLIRFLLLMLPVLACTPSYGFLNQADQGGREAIIEMRPRLTKVADLLQSADLDIATIGVAQQTPGDVTYSLPSGGDVDARQALVDLRRRLIALEQAVGIKVVPFRKISWGGWLPHTDDDLRREILRFRTQTSSLEAQLAQRLSSQRQAARSEGPSPGSGETRSSLPPCPPDGVKNNCFGRHVFPRTGSRYVGEWRGDQSNGLGIEYSADGRIHLSGIWKDSVLVRALALDKAQFPFEAATPVAAPLVDSARAERDRLTSEAEAARRRQQELEQRLAVQAEAARRRQQELEQRLASEAQERERQAAEVEAAQRRQQALEAQLAAAQLQAASRPIAQAASVRSAHALVIGNAAYPGSMRLLNPVNDATAISQKLRALGFTVTTVTDMSRRRLVQAMAEFRKSAANADLSLLFYSGHGVQIFGTNYLLPTDVDQGDVAQATIQGVRLNEVLDNFMPGKTKLVFLDACRDNPLMRSGDRSVSVGLAPMAVAQGTLISYATKDGQVALDGVGARNSPFTAALLEHLGDPNDIAVVLRKVREKVMQATAGKQQPWEYGSLTGGELVLSAIRAAGR